MSTPTIPAYLAQEQGLGYLAVDQGGGSSMATAFIEGSAKKAAGSKVRVPCDFGNLFLIQEGYAITTYDVTGSPSGLTITDAQLDYPYQVSVLVDGGTAGTYDLIFSITLNDPSASEYVFRAPFQVV